MGIFANVLPSFVPGARSFFASLNYIFNRVSPGRIAAVGPDRACAEWLMRNGAYIRWQGQENFVPHYNDLPLDECDTTTYCLEEVHATCASITHHGFAHFCGCDHIKQVTIQNCKYVNDKALEQLSVLAGSLCELEITYCKKVTSKGLQSLACLSVSKSRIRAVGADRACAEWLMRNGAIIRWKGQPHFITHYNNLPLDETVKGNFYIEEIDATDASISHHGFPHFEGCEYITTMKFNNCWHFDDLAIVQLKLIAHTLKDLEIINCAELTDQGILSLKHMRNLEILKLGGLSLVKYLPKCTEELKEELQDCEIIML